MTSKIYSSYPTYLLVLDILKKKKVMLLEDLYKSLKNENNEIGYKELIKALIKLEINGCIRVYNVARNKKQIELLYA